MNEEMKSYKLKDKSSLYFCLLFAIVVLCIIDLRFCVMIYQSGIDDIRNNLRLIIVDCALLFSFTGVILFGLLNIFPVKINVYRDFIEFVYVCRNKIKVKTSDIKVRNKLNEGKKWSAVLYMHKRFTYITSDDFPKLKFLIENPEIKK